MGNIDLQRFKQTFLDESREGLDAMEQGLLRIEQGTGDAETINTIFRAAHSIKGSAGAFGLDDITTLTHLLETLLDQMRSGRRAAGAGEMAALLKSVDVLRSLVSAADAGRNFAPADMIPLVDSLQRLLGVTAAAPAAPSPGAATQQAWTLRFAPHPQLFRSGNDPLRILAELAGLGTVQVECDASRLPAFSALDPGTSYLAWNLKLQTAASQAQIREVFAWVDGDCDLDIQPLLVSGTEPAPRRRASDHAEDRAIAAENSSIRVSIEKVDALINLVGELVITQAMLKQCAGTLDPALHEKMLGGLSLLERNTRDLQDSVMSVRMLPMDFVFSRFPRAIRDLSAKFGKRVRLKTEGEATELDKGVIEKIVDPLNHLVRNSIDHGLETPEERCAAGKDEIGTVTLTAAHRAGNIFIEVSDDGRGLNRNRILASARKRGLDAPDSLSDAETWQLIFVPGLSTAEAVTDVSGRGVGMDVVKKNIVSLGGQVDVTSVAGKGMKVTIRLPLTLAILDGMSVAVGDETFVVPLSSVVESFQPKDEDLKTISGEDRVVRVRGEYIPLYSLREAFSVTTRSQNDTAGTVVLMEAEGRKVAVWVDELVGQQQVVIKNLDTNYRRIPGISGATIMGDGRVALIVDVGGLTRLTRLAKAA